MAPSVEDVFNFLLICYYVQAQSSHSEDLEKNEIIQFKYSPTSSIQMLLNPLSTASLFMTWILIFVQLHSPLTVADFVRWRPPFPHNFSNTLSSGAVHRMSPLPPEPAFQFQSTPFPAAFCSHILDSSHPWRRLASSLVCVSQAALGHPVKLWRDTWGLPLSRGEFCNSRMPWIAPKGASTCLQQ